MITLQSAKSITRTERAADPISDRSARAALAAAVLGFFVITLDAVVVNVALPTISHDFAATMTGLQWVVDGYTLVFAALLLSSGAFSDRLGARQAFAWGLIIFVVASLACGASPNMNALITARFAQGLGAAMMMPASMALIRQAYADPFRRGRAIALWAMGGAVASTSGPVIGGLLVMSNWRWIFFINLPVGLVTLFLLRRAHPSPRRQAPLDVLGQIAAVVAIGSLTYGAIEVGRAGSNSASVMIPLATALLASCSFVFLQRRGSHPMVPPSLLATRNPRLAMAIGFAFMVGYFGLPFVMSLYLQQQRGLSPAQTGAVFVPMMMTGLFLTPFSARLVQRFGARALIVTGLSSMAIGLLSIAALPSSASTWLIAALMVFVGAAGPLVAPPVAGVLLSSVPAELAGTASGVFNTSRQVGGALAVAVFGALLAQSSTFVTGMRSSLIIAASVSLVTAVASIGLRDQTQS